MKYTFIIIFSFFFIVGCATKQPIQNKSATILIKTPNMKFYDKGFITKYHNHIHLTIFNLGKVVLDLKVYENQICQGLFECISTQEFNKKYLHKDYEKKFLYEVLQQNNIYFKDKKNKILIKATFD